MISQKTNLRTRRAGWRRAGLSLLLACVAAHQRGVAAEPESGFLMRTAPYPTYNPPPKKDYNMRLGRLSGRLQGSMQTELNDNINLSETSPSGDVAFFPNISLGFQWPLSVRNLLEFDVGLGYRAYVNHPELNSFQISPDSKLNYQLRIGKVQVLVRDNYQVAVDPLSRPDVNGAPNSLLNFRRINNDAGLQAEWQMSRDVALVSSYDYIIDRSLNRDFTALDRDDHNFAAGLYSNFGSRWTAGLNASVTLTDYLEPVQNDGVSFTVGPQVTFKPTQFISLDGSVGYTRSTYDDSGTVTDRSDFSGVSFSLGARHTINSRLSHNVRGSRSISPGFGSNFNDVAALQYGLAWKFNAVISLSSTFVYERLSSSGTAGEGADRFLTYLSTGWRIARGWNTSLAYSFAWKNSDLAGRDYQQNRLTLDLSHDF